MHVWVDFLFEDVYAFIVELLLCYLLLLGLGAILGGFPVGVVWVPFGFGFGWTGGLSISRRFRVG